MSLHYDDKGKFFTEYVSKEAVQAVIQTSLHRIVGQVYVRVGERVSDQLNKAGPFLPVTDAEIFDLNGNSLMRTPFIVVNLDTVMWMVPQESPEVDNNEME